ncbi:MAG: hypothetical protein FWC99_04080 [Coriobacteriia bacterium]|nr:hypothetical protein [Coriobacteriia bacterium]
MMTTKLYRGALAVTLALTMLAVSFVPIFGGNVSEAEASPAGFPMFAWGTNSNGLLGLGDTENRHIPTRVGDGYWLHVSGDSGGSHGISASGHLYGWGAAWNAAQMGQGGVDPGVGSHLLSPTRIGSADNWAYVSTRANAAAAINADGELFHWGTSPAPSRNVPTRVGTRTDWASVTHLSANILAIDNQNRLWGWGNNANAVLGMGHTSAITGPSRVGTGTDWVSVSGSIQSVLGITASGRLYSWGANNLGQLGHGDTTNRTVPTRVGTASNWVGVAMTTQNTAAAVNSDGELFTWGAATAGALGNGTDSGNVLTPTRVEGRSDWVLVNGSNGHFLAFTEAGELFGWGNNGGGRLGLGDTNNRTTPTSILRVVGFSGSSRGGGARSFMLFHLLPVTEEIALTKNLQKPEGTPLLSDKTFTFTFDRHSFNESTTTVNVNRVPVINDLDVTVTNASPSTAAGGITTRSETRNALEDVVFTEPGVFRWTVQEMAESSNTNTVPPGHSVMNYSPARYELAVWVTQEVVGISEELSIYDVRIHRITDAQGNPVNPPVKVDELAFTNTYTRSTVSALATSKTVVGEYANLTTPFTFEVLLTRTAFCLPSTTYVVRIYNADGSFNRLYTFASNTPFTFTLLHGQSATFGDTRFGGNASDELIVGTNFTITEQAAPSFIAEVELYVNGSPMTIPSNVNHNTALSTGLRLVGDGTNSADFTNTHSPPPLTGLVIANNITLIVLGVVAIVVGTTLAVNRRKRIEDLSILQTQEALGK